MLRRIDQNYPSTIERTMSNYSRFGPYMDPNVFRSTSHPVYHVDTDLVNPRYVATDALRSLRHGDQFIEPLPGRDYTGPRYGQSYRSDRRSIDRHSTRGVDNLVRKYDIARHQVCDLELTDPEQTRT
jgi:hypothetical protein